MRRRDFVVRLGSAALGWPLAAHAQTTERARRIGVLLVVGETDTYGRQQVSVLKEELARLGWIDGKNLVIDVRWADGDGKRASALAKDLLALRPEVLLAQSSIVTKAILGETRITPTVFVQVSDPVGSGFVKALSKPGGNATGFVNLESSVAEKWLQLLKEIAPRVKHVAVMFDPKTPYVGYYLRPIVEAAAKLKVTVRNAEVGSDSDIERAMAELGRSRDNGLIVMTDVFTYLHRRLILDLAARHKTPAVYAFPALVDEGGLICYSVDSYDLFRRAAGYVDRILRGANPQELPVQFPTKFEMVINARTAKAIGLKIPPSLLERADRVIE